MVVFGVIVADNFKTIFNQGATIKELLNTIETEKAAMQKRVDELLSENRLLVEDAGKQLLQHSN